MLTSNVECQKKIMGIVVSVLAVPFNWLDIQKADALEMSR